MLYIVLLVSFLDIIFIGDLELLAIPIIQHICFPRAAESLNLGSFIVLTFLVQMYFILTTEFTIHTNSSLLVESAQEAGWTFGQTLAIALIAIPLIDVTEQIWKERDTLGNGIKRLGRRISTQRHGKHEGVKLSMICFLIINLKCRFESLLQDNLSESECCVNPHSHGSCSRLSIPLASSCHSIVPLPASDLLPSVSTFTLFSNLTFWILFSTFNFHILFSLFTLHHLFLSAYTFQSPNTTRRKISRAGAD